MLKACRINDHEAFSFLIKRNIFEEHKHSLVNRYYIGFKDSEEVIAIIALKRLSDLTSELFFSIKKGAAQSFLKFIKENNEKVWELVDCKKLLTFTKDSNKESLFLSTNFGFKRIGYLENYGTKNNETYGMIIKELNRG